MDHDTKCRGEGRELGTPEYTQCMTALEMADRDKGGSIF